MSRFLFVAVLAVCCAVSPLYAGTAFYDPIYGTAKTSNVVYGTGLVNEGANSVNLTLDLYRPTDIGQGALPAQSPGIVLVHGGGFTSGTKGSMSSLATSLAQYGYTVISIDYRLFGDDPPLEPGIIDNIDSLPFTLPPPPYASLPMPAGLDAVNAAVYDASKAMNWLIANASTYGVDPNHIALGGFSAGAVTSLIQGYLASPAMPSPQAVLSFSGSLYGTEAVLSGDLPPAFIVHGTADTTVPFSGSQAVADKLTSLGVYNEFYVQPGVGHTTNFNLVTNGETLFDHQIDFLRTFLVPEPSSVLLAGIALASVVLCARRKLRLR
jgi:acetyl esterase/lipase